MGRLQRIYKRVHMHIAQEDLRRVDCEYESTFSFTIAHGHVDDSAAALLNTTSLGLGLHVVINHFLLHHIIITKEDQ